MTVPSFRERPSSQHLSPSSTPSLTGHSAVLDWRQLLARLLELSAVSILLHLHLPIVNFHYQTFRLNMQKISIAIFVSSTNPTQRELGRYVMNLTMRAICLKCNQLSSSICKANFYHQTERWTSIFCFLKKHFTNSSLYKIKSASRSTNTLLYSVSPTFNWHCYG